MKAVVYLSLAGLAVTGCNRTVQPKSAILQFGENSKSGLYVLVLGDKDGKFVNQADETLSIDFNHEHVAKIKNHDLLARAINLKASIGKEKEITLFYEAKDTSSSNSRCCWLIAHRYDNTVWFYLGTPEEKSKLARNQEHTISVYKLYY